MKSITIAQITDIHIGKVDESPNGMDVRSNFLRVLEEVRKSDADYVVVSGDLCYDVGEVDIYQWIKGQLEGLEMPYFVIAGNHDDSRMIAEVFDLHQHLHHGDLFYDFNIGGWGKLIFLDSSKGIVSGQQLAFLKEACKDSSIPCLLFVHHPPTLANVPHMDKNYALQNIETVQAVIGACASSPHAIFCGHYHCGRSVQLPHLATTVFISPSSAFFQINPDVDYFEIGNRCPAWRKIIWDGKQLSEDIKYTVAKVF